MLDPGSREAGRVGLDDEGAHALATARIRIGQREDGQQVRHAAVGDEALAAVQDVVVPVANGSHAVRRDVAAGRRLGQGERDQPLAGGQAREVAILLLVAAGQQDGQGAELLHDRDQARGRIGARDLLDQDRLGDRVECRAAVALLEARPEQVLPSQELLEVPRELLLLVDLRGARRDPFLGKLADDGAQLIVIGGGQVGHAGSSDTACETVGRSGPRSLAEAPLSPRSAARAGWAVRAPAGRFALAVRVGPAAGWRRR